MKRWFIAGVPGGPDTMATIRNRAAALQALAD